jgi:protein SCO1/2
MRASAMALGVMACLASAPAAADGTSLFQQPWRFRDERGGDVMLSRWRGAPIVLTMGYTSCGTRCPIVIDKLQRVAKRYAAARRKAEFVLVTLDPERDRPEVLESFKHAQGIRGDNWHLLSASPATTRALVHFLGLRVTYDDPHIDHETKIFLFDGAGNLARTLRGWNFGDEEAMLPGP